MTPQDRRSLLEPDPNPGGKLDYVSAFDGRIVRDGWPGPIQVTVRYVPDRMILPTRSFAAYLQALATAAWSSLEELGALVINDVADELVPRWIEVHVSARADLDGTLESHAVFLSDRQPRWDNPNLLARLKRY